MSEMKQEVTIEKTGSDRYFDFYSINGLSVEEMNSILHAGENGKDNRDVLVDVMEKHGKNLGSWRWGYGIYSIKHFGGHLIVEVGNNCD